MVELEVKKPESNYLYRFISSPYFEEDGYIFALDHYKPKEEGEDKFSKDILWFYKWGYEDLMDEILQDFISLLKMRFVNDEVIDWDYIIPHP